MILVDEFSRMMWVAFLKEKSEAFDKFKIFENRVENESGVKIKFLDQIEEENSLQMILTYFVKKIESKDSYQVQNPLNRMTL